MNGKDIFLQINLVGKQNSISYLFPHDKDTPKDNYQVNSSCCIISGRKTSLRIFSRSWHVCTSTFIEPKGIFHELLFCGKACRRIGVSQWAILHVAVVESVAVSYAARRSCLKCRSDQLLKVSQCGTLQVAVVFSIHVLAVIRQVGVWL